jgi:hypothetical protein
MKRNAGLYVAWLIALVILGFAVTGRHPYSFYTVLRWICCAVFAFSALTALEQDRGFWVWVFGVLAVVFNPIAPLHLKRDTWQSVDWAAIGVTLIAAIFFLRDKRIPGEPKAPPTVSAPKQWEVIADNLSKAGWTWGCVSAVDSSGRTVWIADTSR